MSNAAKQPTLFEVFGRHQSTIVPEVNEEALMSFTDILTQSGDDVGKVILLRSPRAGYGKTLLLQAVSGRLKEDFRFLAVEPSGGGRIDGEVALESVVRRLSEVLPASGGLTEFDIFARRLLALGLKPLLISGEIPSHDREGALFAIENRPIETFDFHHQQAATAHWTQSNFEVLGPRLTSELSELSGCSLRGCAYWIDLLFRYATTPPEKVERTRLLSDAIFGDIQGQRGSLAEERLQSLLALLGLNDPVVLVFDETEGLSNQPETGLRVAAFIVQLRQACPALTVVLSLNEDVWQTGLRPLMPGGLEDRLTEFEVVLGGLSRVDAETLLKSRFGKDAQSVSALMTWPDPIFARAVLKEASKRAQELVLTGKALSEESFAMEESSAPTSVLPPPIEKSIEEPGFSGFEKKVVSDPRPSESVAFESESPEVIPKVAASITTAPKPEEVAKPKEEVSSSEPTDPFADARLTSTQSLKSPVVVELEEPDLSAESDSPSPFAVAPERDAFASASPKQEVKNSFFEEAEEQFLSNPEPEPILPPKTEVKSEPVTSSWSAESAVEHFAATQEDHDLPPTGSAFDAKPAETASEEEPSPFQLLKEEKEKLAAEAIVEKEIPKASPKEEAVSTESSPFVVNEPVESKLEPEPKLESAQPPALPKEAQLPSPFSVSPKPMEPTSAVPVRNVAPQQNVYPTDPASPVQPASQPKPLTSADFEPAKVATTPSQVQPQVQSSPFTITGPVRERAQPTSVQEEVITAQSAPPSSTPGETSSVSTPAQTPPAVAPEPTAQVVEKTTSSQQSSEVEELLSQFKKRFGAPE